MSKRLWPVIGKSLLGLIAIMVATLIVGIGVGFLVARGVVDEDNAIVTLMTIFAVVLMIGAMVVSVAWMRAIDEAAREAHKAAWFWGGCSGMAVGGVGIVLASLPQAEALQFTAFDGRTDPVAYMAAGAFAMMMLMTLGYVIVWAWWWLARTRG
jgi:magnesium-transporting ATPase (P-type)